MLTHGWKRQHRGKNDRGCRDLVGPSCGCHVATGCRRGLALVPNHNNALSPNGGGVVLDVASDVGADRMTTGGTLVVAFGIACGFPFSLCTSAGSAGRLGMAQDTCSASFLFGRRRGCSSTLLFNASDFYTFCHRVNIPRFGN